MPVKAHTKTQMHKHTKERIEKEYCCPYTHKTGQYTCIHIMNVNSPEVYTYKHTKERIEREYCCSLEASL